jgi:hypothetical protein
MKTTLNKIREQSPCVEGWAKLLHNLGKTKADDEPLSITTILDSNGLDDAIWCLHTVDGYQSEMRLYAVDCARSVQHLMKDERSIKALDVAELYAYGLATYEELSTSRAAASDAAYAAREAAAWAAARAAAKAAAKAAARAAARDAAYAARDAAARDAAWAAARASAWAAARAAAYAARSADYAAAKEVQADFLRIVCAEIEQREVME